MGQINYKAIYEKNHTGWLEMTENPGKFEALLAGHYSDSNHFVYELIQNAEDTGATCVVFEYYSDKICFYHDGKPFDEDDVRGVSSMLETTKADDAKQIGKFGMGFKSVFKYTCTPEIYSDNEAFKIENYLLPEEIKTPWDYQIEMKAGLSFQLGDEYYIPFGNSEHLTKVVLPFQKREKNGNIHRIDGSDIVKKFRELEPEILLFLSHIKNLFWIDKMNGKYEKYQLIEDDKTHLITCQIKGNAVTSLSRRYDDRYYYKYKKNVDYLEYGEAQISLAFLTNSQQKSIQKIDGTDIWVFFPTKDSTGLPFLLHGSFETAVSREKLMRPSYFNEKLLASAADLFIDAIEDFKEKGLICQAFIRQILMPAFGDNTIPGLKEKVTECFLREQMLPVKGDKLANPRETSVTVPFDMLDLEKEELFTESFPKDTEYVVINDEKSAGFSEYYNWLVDDLKVKVYSMDIWGNNIRKIFDSIVEKADYSKMLPLYSFLNEYNLAEYVKENKSTRKKSSYEDCLQVSVKLAWSTLRKSKVLINGENEYVSAFDDEDNEKVFLSSTSEYHKIAKTAVVLSIITDNFKTLLEDSFKIKEFDNFEYVKNKILVKYSKYPKQVDFTEKFIKEYTDDLLLISRLMMTSSYTQEIQNLVSERCLILAKTEDDKMMLFCPSDVYKPTSIEGADLKVYCIGVGKPIYFLDEEFYLNMGISLDSIQKFGICTTPIEDGPRENSTIKALDSFKPFMSFKFLRKNIEYIQDNPKTSIAKKKSACILKIVLENIYKMTGRYYENGSGDIKTGYCKILDQLRGDDWLYSNGELCYAEDITRKQLDSDVYSEINLSKYGNECKVLGLAVDESETIIDNIDKLDMSSKQDLLAKLAKELGVEISVKEMDGVVFDPDSFKMDEFPIRYIVNMDRLERYIENEFYAADPVRYKEVVVLKRSSGNRSLNRAYVKEMYTNQFGKMICQGCRKSFPENEQFAVEIANFGVDMEQLHLCLCPSCYQKYETIKKTRVTEYKDTIRRALENTSISTKEPYYKVEVSNMTLFFTQIHLAEIQSILFLLDKYGVPMEKIEVKYNKDFVSNGQLDEIVIHDGEMIEYETLKDMKTHRVTIDIDKYSLHKEMDGRPIGVVFEYKGEKYRITKKL